MGAVFLARDPAIDRDVAIKLMRSGIDVTELRERFTREAKSIGRLHHPNIVTVFDVGEHDGEPFIAMEYVEGQTLARVIADAMAVRSRKSWPTSTDCSTACTTRTARESSIATSSPPT